MILLAIIAGVILFLFFYFYWPIINDRYISSPAKINVPEGNKNTNIAVVEEKKIEPEKLSRILIPALGIDAVLIFPEEGFAGDANNFVEANLDNGVVYYPNGVLNLLKENISFFGHSSSIHPMAEYARVFVNLDRLKTGDEIILLAENEEPIKYKVTVEPTIIPANDGEIVRPDKGEGLITLVTCWPPGTTSKRMYVMGQLAE